MRVTDPIQAVHDADHAVVAARDQATMSKLTKDELCAPGRPSLVVLDTVDPVFEA